MNTIAVSEVNNILNMLLGNIQVLQNHVNSLEDLIKDKVNPEQREFIDDDDLEKYFGITRAIRYRMLGAGLLKPYKLTGKNSKSLYRYSEVIDSIEQNVQFKKS